MTSGHWLMVWTYFLHLQAMTRGWWSKMTRSWPAKIFWNGLRPPTSASGFKRTWRQCRRKRAFCEVWLKHVLEVLILWFTSSLPSKTSIYRGFSIAMFDYQRLIGHRISAPAAWAAQLHVLMVVPCCSTPSTPSMALLRGFYKPHHVVHCFECQSLGHQHDRGHNRIHGAVQLKSYDLGESGIPHIWYYLEQTNENRCVNLNVSWYILTMTGDPCEWPALRSDRLAGWMRCNTLLRQRPVSSKITIAFNRCSNESPLRSKLDPNTSKYRIWLVVWNIWISFPYIGNVIIPIDELIFSRGVETSKYRILLYISTP